MKGESFDNEYVKFEFLDHVVKGTFKKGPVNLEVAKMIVEERLKFTRGEAVPLMITNVGMKTLEKEAREYFSSEQGIEGIKASALVSSSPFGRHLANFFINITVIKPKIPTKVFSTEEEAYKWLSSFV